MSEYKHLNANGIIENFQKRINSIRTGRVNASVLDDILVDAYGTKMHIKELATVTLPEPSQILITPFDKTVVEKIEKAINDSNLGVNPINDGAGIRLNFPPLTEESRKEKAKEVGSALEEARISVRNNRQEALKVEKHKKEGGEITEDELKDFEEAIQQEVNNLNKELEEVAEQKKKDLMKF